MFDTLKSKLHIDDINSHSNKNPAPAITIYPFRESGDAPYELEEDVLRSAIYIPKNFRYGRDGKVPVILVPGTGAYGGEAFEHNFAKLLKDTSFADPVWLNVPGRMNGIAHRNAEHVAYAIQYIAAACKVKVAVVAWSQGNLATQWSLKYWPSTRLAVANFIALSADFHGTVEVSLTLPLKVGLGNPSVWAQKRHSKFVQALRADDGDSAYVPTTSIYSATDEIVQPQTGTKASAFLKDVRGVGVFNCELQRVAPFKPAGLVYSHETVLSNPISWALAADAILNGGPGQLARINVKELYQNIIAPGLTLGDGAKTEGLLLSTGASIVAYPRKTITEPKLPAYATGHVAPVNGGARTEREASAAARILPQRTESGKHVLSSAQLVPQSGKLVAGVPQVPTVVKMAQKARHDHVEKLIPAPLSVAPRDRGIIAETVPIHNQPPAYNEVAT